MNSIYFEQGLNHLKFQSIENYILYKLSHKF